MAARAANRMLGDAAEGAAWAGAFGRAGTVAESALIGKDVEVHLRSGKVIHRHQMVRPDDGPHPETHPTPGLASRAVAAVKSIGSKALDTKIGRFLVAAEHKLAIVAHKVRDVAKAAALRRRPPLDADGIARLSRVLAVADFVGGYVAGGLVGAAVAPLAGKAVATCLPSASALYLAYATVRDPAGVWAAACAVIRGAAVHESAAEAAWVDSLAEMMGGEDADWKEAVFLAAIGHGKTPEEAVEMARDVGPMPEELPAAGVEDFGGEETVAESLIVAEGSVLVDKVIDVHRDGKVIRQHRKVLADVPAASKKAGKVAAPPANTSGASLPAAKPSRVPEKQPSEKAQRAKDAAVRVDADVQRYAEEYNEPRFAKVMGGLSFPDGEPVDVAIPGSDGKIAHAVELKTMTVGNNDKLTMNAYAQVRKIVWEQAQKATFHTVVSDDRQLYGQRRPDESKRVYYYRRGVAGSARIGTMHRCESEAELKQLMAMPEEDLPPGAGRTDAHLRVGRWVPLKGERGYRNTKTGEEVRPKK